LLSVAHDHFSGMRTALQHCIEAGRKRTALILTVEANEIVRDKWLAAYRLLSGPGRPLAQLPVWQGPFHAARLRSWLTECRPDALVGTFDDRLRSLVQAAGRRVPEDVALASVCLRRSERFHAGIYERSTVIGARAVDLVVSALNHNESGPLPMRQALHIEGEWRHGPSMPRVA
jgi:LacI family transcriptional regulator